MTTQVNPSSSSSETIYHYPPIFQDTPAGPNFTGPVKDNQPYSRVGSAGGGNQQPDFIQDVYNPNLLWSKNPDGELVQTNDGTQIYVPPRPKLPGDDSFNQTLADQKASSKTDDSENLPPMAEVPMGTFNPFPGGMPNNPYAMGSGNEYQLQNTINNWIKQNFGKPTMEDFKKDLEQNWFPFYQSLAPSAETIASARNSILKRGRLDEIKRIIQTTSLNSISLSDDQLLKLASMREAADKIFSLINDLDLWNEYPSISAISKVYGEEVVKDTQSFEKLIEEFSTFTSLLPPSLNTSLAGKQEKEVKDGWNCLEDRDQHLQALADVLFDGNLVLQKETEWERRFNHLKGNLEKCAYELNRHIPKSLDDVKLSMAASSLGFLNGVVEGSNSPLMQPLYKPIKSLITGELTAIPLTQEQSSTWGYHNVKLATELVMDGFAFQAAGKVLKVFKPVIQYAWQNKAALKAAMKAPATLGKDFLAKAGLISPASGELLAFNELKTTLKTSKFCLHDAGIALEKKGSKGYFHCIKEFNRRQGVRGYCIEKGFNKAMTEKVMAVETLEMEVHHMLTPKSIKGKAFSKKFARIIDKYGLDLEGSWNKIRIPHKGRHFDVYHEYCLEKLGAIHKAAAGDRTKFLKLFEQEIRIPLEKNPLLVRGIGLGK